MKLTDTCIERPVFTTVLSLVILVVGLIFYSRLDIRGTPNIAPPIITVTSFYEGADALYMEKQITTRIEKALKTTKNLDIMESTSSVGSSNIVLRFGLDADIEIALNDVRSKISDLSAQFPDDMKLPSVAKVDSDAFPSLWISVNSDRHDSLELTRIMDEQIKSVLEKLPSVGNSRIFGGRYYTMRIEPDPAKLYQHNVAPLEIEKAVRAQNRDYPAGDIKTESKNFSLRLSASLNDPKQFKEIIIKRYPNGALLKLKDIAKVELEPLDSNVILRYNGNRSMAVGLIKQSTANVIELSEDALAKLEDIRKSLPAGVKAEVAYDASRQVQASIKEVYFTIFEAIILVGLVTYIFLGSARITLIPLVAIPISLIGTFAVMYAMGFSINTFTLLAMILAIGLVVDDAIVMLENIYRHKESLGKSPIRAAFDASREIGFAIIAMTITLASVFFPIGFLEGFLGKLFVEFAWTLAFCVLISGFVALTLTPMMTGRVMKASPNNKQVKGNTESGEISTSHGSEDKLFFLQAFDRFMARVQEGYIKSLNVAINNKVVFSLICLASIGVLVFSFVAVDKTFIPPEDDGFLQIAYTGPEGSSLQESEKVVEQTESIIKSFPEVHGFFQVVGFQGAEKGFAFVPLKDWDKRKKSSFDIQQEMNEQFSQIPGMSIFAFAPPSLGSGGSGKAIDFVIQSSKDYSLLDQVSKKFVDRMKQNKAFFNVDREFKSSTPTLDIVVNREKAYRYNVELDTLGTTIQYLIAGKSIGDFRMGNDIYDVIIRFDDEDRNSAASLKKINIKSTDGNNIPLQVVADVVEQITVKSYNHYNSFKSIGITSDLNQGHTLEEAVKYIEEMQSDLMEEGLKIVYEGQIKDMKESNKGSYNVFLFALVFIFLVLAAQFESFGDSLMILVSVPFSITGGVLILLLFGNSVNMYSNIGLVTLIGLITKNAIMLVEFSNQLREQGKSVKESIITAAALRLRPILMTTVATICGAIPLVLASGAGSASRNSIGLVIVGGMAVGTLFTIFVIPVLYQSFKREQLVARVKAPQE